MSAGGGLRPGSILREVLQTAFRLAPWPTESGLRRSGNPGPESPVLVTGNYDLTVRRLLRALDGMDAWVVVAPSGGINVWCAAAGGQFGTSQVVTALKTSGIEEHVQHRRVILPQLAATGVSGRELTRRCGWRARFGPVYATDLPRYLAQGGKTAEMRVVRFGARERVEMALSWGLPAALLTGGLSSWLRPGWAWPLALLSLATALGIFTVYDRIPGPRRLVFAAATALLSVLAVGIAGGGLVPLAAAVIASVGLTAILTYDYTGSTPIEGGSHFEERRWTIALDEDRCKGVHSCVEVCPEGAFTPIEDPRGVDLSRPDACIRCGACVVQCPMDALHFRDEAGGRIEPDVIRRYKLNLLGQRRVDAVPPA